MGACLSERLIIALRVLQCAQEDTENPSCRWAVTVRLLLHSYYDIMLAPTADALKHALSSTAQEGSLKALPCRSRPVVYFALQVSVL